MLGKESLKGKIINTFNNRTNWALGKQLDLSKHEDILDLIARTYHYYEKKFENYEIESSKIASGDRFINALKMSEPPRTIADLYLYRLVLNLKTITEINDENDETKASILNGVLTINKATIKQQIEIWGGKVERKLFSKDDLNMLQGKKHVVDKNLYDKVIAHELSHMSAKHDINGMPGFKGGGTKRTEDGYTYSSYLEEICAELTGLNITKQKIVSQKRIPVNNGDMLEIGGYNPESSNFMLSSFIELAPFAFGPMELEAQRLINPEAFLQSLNKKYSNYAGDNGIFAYRIETDCDKIVNEKVINVKFNTLKYLQSDFIKIGIDRMMNTDYQSIEEFQSDVGCFIRAEPMLLRYYQKGNDKPAQSENIRAYQDAKVSIENIFNKLKAKGLFDKDYTFDNFINEGKLVIENAKRKSIGRDPIVLVQTEEMQ